MNVIYIGRPDELLKVLPGRPYHIQADASIDEFREQLIRFNGRADMTLIFHAPLSIQKQMSLLKFVEEFSGDIVIYSPTYISDLIVPIQGRFIIKVGQFMWDEGRYFSEWNSEGRQVDFGPRSYPHLLANSSMSRSAALFFKTVNLAERGAW